MSKMLIGFRKKVGPHGNWETNGDKALMEGQIQMIQMLQRLNMIRESTIEELSGHEESQLNELSEELQRQLRVRPN